MDMQKISTYNGDSTDNYDWSQTIQEITVQIPIPEGTNAKQMDIKIQSKRLFVKIKSQDKPLIDGEL
jgi:HSP20 family molecular chaperone IbpA